jgi:hypothetical protein
VQDAHGLLGAPVHRDAGTDEIVADLEELDAEVRRAFDAGAKGRRAASRPSSISARAIVRSPSSASTSATSAANCSIR